MVERLFRTSKGIIWAAPSPGPGKVGAAPSPGAGPGEGGQAQTTDNPLLVPHQKIKPVSIGDFTHESI